ncbi:MAG: M6 family metalloprotease domain-containing protein, partial [candidate division Zixibacteria bacterium]|nr:M6 family metalloprotease domain-containing protein [candidate division Zixibacteria bacterium]
MLVKGIKAIQTIMVILFLSIPVYAVMPPAPGVELPAYVKQAQQELSKHYGTTGIARRLQEIKLEKELAIKSGETIPTRSINFNLPVLMGDYGDAFHIFTAAEFQEQLFGSNPTGSMSDYFDEVSNGQFQLSGTVFGPYTAGYNQNYYALDGGFPWNFPRGTAGFVWRLAQESDPDIDFSLFDNDGPDGIPNSGDDDGIVDGIVAIFPDGAMEYSDNDNMLSQMGRLDRYAGEMFTTDDARNGGGFIKIDAYFVTSGETGDGTVDEIRNIGVYCHEFGHILGLPDLYDTDGGVGTWGLMAYGGWGATYHSPDADDRPTHLSAWCKELLGWVTPTLITETETLQVPPVQDNGVVYKIWENAFQGSRYFLLENRTQVGFDSDILAEGLLIWHCINYIDLTKGLHDMYMIGLEQADGLEDIVNDVNRMDAGDPFPGSTNNTSFNDLTNPSAQDVYDINTGISIEGISYGPGSDVTVTITPRDYLGYTISYVPEFTYARKWSHELYQTTYGATRFTAPEMGHLVEVTVGKYPPVTP